MATIGFSLGVSSLHAGLPTNLGSGLRELLKAGKLGDGQLQDFLEKSSTVQMDDAGRVQVNIYLKRKAALAHLPAKLKAAGGEIVATRANYRNGVISVYLPLTAVKNLADARDVRSITLVPVPRTFVGATTAQAASVHRTTQVNTPGIVTAKGLWGEGISVGVLSDSYDRASGSNASDGVASRDLPGPGNPINPHPVAVVAEGRNLGPLNGRFYTDEGRGMLEIIHDLAPRAKLAFATAFDGDVAFANNIERLRTDSSALCDVIVDDVIYLNEPMFSDGMIAQAVDKVVTSSVLPGKPVAYFSAAGNNGNAGYSSPFRLVSRQTAAGLTNQNLKISQVDPMLYMGGFHDFDPGSGIDISQEVTCKGGSATIVFQWNDPFDVPGGGVTTDYNLLVFSKAGDFISALSGIDDNLATNQPIELPANDLVADETYQLVITRTVAGTKKADLLRYVVFTGGSFSGRFLKANEGTIYGHSAASHSNAVAAYVYDDDPSDAELTPALEEFSSPGPVTICFDANGQRLATPIYRQKPTMAGADGVNTTFFPPGPLSSTDYDGDGFPNFFGTSAAAPSVAGVAALVLEAAGGPNSLTPQALADALSSTAFEHDLDPRFAVATGVLDDSNIQASITGNGVGADDSNFFQVGFTAPVGVSLTSLSIDLELARLEFDTDPVTGFGPAIGSLTTGVTRGGFTTSVTKPTPSGGFQHIQGDAPPGNFAPGGLLAFGIDRDVFGTGMGGNSADLLEGATVVFRFSNGRSVSAVFENAFGTGVTHADGAGLVDALGAATQVAK